MSLALACGASASPFSALHWRSIGPAASGGRIAAVAGSDKAPFLYYLGGAGGVFRTTNGGISWDAVFTDKLVASVGAITVSPSDLNDVWVGTGEANPRADISYGKGVWRSRDGGKSWKHLGLDETSAIPRILVDPRHPNVALVAALGDPFVDSVNRGVYRTTDGGKTWSKTLYVGPSTGASDIAWDPAHPSVVFAGMWQFRRKPWLLVSGGPESGLYRSRDSGAHWQRLQGHGLPSGFMGRIGIAVAPGHAQRVYAMIQSKSGYVWRSNNGGDSWQLTRASSIVNERPFYFSHLAVDPVDRNHVYALSVEFTESRDGGQTFKAIDGAENVDYHALWISSDGVRMIAGHDAGWSLSLDRGKTWDWRTNLAISQTYHVGYDNRNPYQVCGGFQDAETWCGPSNSLNPQGILNRDWYSMNGSDGTWVWPDPLDPDLVWNSAYWGSLGIWNARTHELADISPFQYDYDAIGTVGIPYRFGWEAPIAFSPQDGHTAYFGGNVLFTTNDRGTHWRVMSPDLTLNDPAHQQVSGGPITIEGAGAETYDVISDIGPSAVEPGLIWIGTDDGLIQLTRDGGATWRNVSVKGIAPYGRVSTVEPSRTSGSAAYAVIDRHLLGDRTAYVFKTQDYGVSWQRITRGLPPNVYAHVVREDPKNHRVLYAGLEQGVWVSFDTGASWQSMQADLPTSSVRDLRVQPDAGDLVAGTHGNSMFILDDLTVFQQFDQAKSTAAYLFPPRPAYMFALWEPEQPGPGTGPPTGAFAGDNPDYGVIISYYLRTKVKSAPTIEIADASGHVVRHLGGKDALPNVAGVNRTAWDLMEDPPVMWTGTPKFNQQPYAGPEAIPGHYVVTVKVGSTTLTSGADVLPDPRATWTHDQYVARHAFMVALKDQLSAVDSTLNNLDRLNTQLVKRRAQVAARAGSAKLLDQIEMVDRRRTKIFAALTSNPQALQDADFLPDRLREQILAVVASLNYPLGYGTGNSGASYLGPPTEASIKMAAQVKQSYDNAMAMYERFIKEDVAALNTALTAARLKSV
jgi:photosystem II stability/assembly factor-like uncharacterized protein